jgi:hypothetical protein
LIIAVPWSVPCVLLTRTVWPTDKENPDLFWALSGGGGNFGIVTSKEAGEKMRGCGVWQSRLEARGCCAPSLVVAAQTTAFKTGSQPAKTGERTGGKQTMPRGGLRSTSFKKGQSGNPRGRPQRPEVRKFFVDVRAAAREVTQEAISTLAAIMKDQKAPAAARISAAVALLDRGHGRPFQAVDVKLDWDPNPLTDEELMTLERILTRATPLAPAPGGREMTVWSGAQGD